MQAGQNAFGQQMKVDDYNNEINFANWKNNLQPQSGGLMGGLSGAVSGAGTGFMVGGPWGALAGGVAGGALGALSKKQQTR
jgi:outer membrane lipoprotein SlyB